MSNKTKQQIGFGTNVPAGKHKKNVPQLESVDFKTTGKVEIMPILKDQIDYLHQMIGSKEWSGILFYTIEKGTIGEIDTVVIQAHYVMPLNIGSSVYTEYDPDEAALDAFDMFEGAEDMERGTIHTHHNMQAFFSGTDTEDLIEKVADNSHSYYLSLIVNIQEAYVAKIAVVSQNNFTEYNVKIGEAVHPIRMPNIKKTALAYEVNVTLPPGKETPLPFRKQVEKIIEASKPSKFNPRSSSKESHYYNDYYDREAFKGTYHKADTSVPGMEEREEKEDKKKEVAKPELPPMLEFADLLTVGNEFGSIQEVLLCETTEDLLNTIVNCIRFYSGITNTKEGEKEYHTQLKEYIISKLFEDNTIVTASDIKEIAQTILNVLININECVEKETEDFLTATKTMLANMKTYAFSELTSYKEQNLKKSS